MSRIQPATTAEPGQHISIQPKILYFGTPVALLSTENPDGTFNLAPMSSAWALDYTVVLGLGTGGQTAQNLLRGSEVVINLPSVELWQQVERLAPLTGRNPVPESKSTRSRFEPEKFEAVGLSQQASECVSPPRVAECPLQLEARVTRITHNEPGEFIIVEADVLRVHAHSALVPEGTDHINPHRWSPLIYNFRHYFGLGEQLGFSFRSETPDL